VVLPFDCCEPSALWPDFKLVVAVLEEVVAAFLSILNNTKELYLCFE
jgi:hypothetical protein